MRHSIRFDSRNKIEFENILRKHTFGTSQRRTIIDVWKIRWNRRMLSSLIFWPKTDERLQIYFEKWAFNGDGKNHRIPIFSAKFFVSILCIENCNLENSRLSSSYSKNCWRSTAKQAATEKQKKRQPEKSASKSNISRMVQLLPVCIERASKEYH